MNRIKELDILRGIAICFMVIGHTWFTTKFAVGMTRIIYAFHMPLFFVVSGFFYKKPSCRADIYKKIKSLLLPYYVMGIGYIILYLALGRLDGIFRPLLNLFVFPTGLTNVPGRTTSIIGEPALWFLMVLFVMNMVYAFFDVKINNRIIRYGVWGLLIILSYIIFPQQKSIELPFGLRIVFQCMPFYCIGIWFRKQYKDIKDYVEVHKKTSIILWILSCIIYTFIAVNNPSISNLDIMRNIWGIVPLSFINAIIGIWIFWMISCFIANYCNLIGKFLTFCGVNTIVFVCINHIVIESVKTIITKVSGNIVTHIQMIMVCVLSVLICALVTEVVMNTKLKIIFGKKIMKDAIR